MTSLKQVLIDRDGETPESADEIIQDAKERIYRGSNPEDILHDDLGLEPDYIFDLIG